jgi:hypothetical protein
VAKPPDVIVITDVSLEVHAAVAVTSLWLLSENVAVAVSWTLSPIADGAELPVINKRCTRGVVTGTGVAVTGVGETGVVGLSLPQADARARSTSDANIRFIMGHLDFHNLRNMKRDAKPGCSDS